VPCLSVDALVLDSGFAYAVEMTDEIAAVLPAEDDVETAAILNIEAARLRRAIRELPSFDAWLLGTRYGLSGYQRLSLREISDRLNTTHTSVRRMERRALRRLRAIYGLEDVA
jgi:DNA-directed RNA polymerase sigma subunit (sigma70/sigma32)